MFTAIWPLVLARRVSVPAAMTVQDRVGSVGADSRRISLARASSRRYLLAQSLLGGIYMGQTDGVWYCDVCSATIPLGQKRFPLDRGAICCSDCWNAGAGKPAKVEPPAPPPKALLLCDVCNRSIPPTQMYQTLPDGRICCASCWQRSVALAPVQQQVNANPHYNPTHNRQVAQPAARGQPSWNTTRGWWKGMTLPAWLLAGCAFAQLSGFFLPWIDLGFYSIDGYALPSKLNSIADVPFGRADTRLKLLYLLYLIPLLSLALATASFRQDAVWKVLRFLIAIATAVVIGVSCGPMAYHSLSSGHNVLAFGFFLTATGCLVSIFVSLIPARGSQKAAAYPLRR
jgi:hypothetical protein